MTVQKMGGRSRLSYCALLAIFLATGVPEGMAASPDAATKAFDRGAALLRQGDLPAAAEAVKKDEATEESVDGNTDVRPCAEALDLRRSAL